ncbi:hypothetical protein E9351_01865 [Salmonella enterica]|nr:hypothetical protein [Salmonella enterica]EEH4680232.1 AAA family ATPase [Salmonella enterica]
MAARHHAFILAGTGSGCGKTTVTLGLLRLLQKRALRVQPFKVGPDYLDTGWHTAICGVASRNLDSFMLPPPVLNALFCEQMRQADIAVIEGVMGLYDGYGVDPNYCSTAAMAKQLGCPVILLVDGKAVSTSLAATVMGFQHFDPTLNLAGVIVNRVTSDAHYQLLKNAIEHYCSLPVLGYAAKTQGITRSMAAVDIAIAEEEKNKLFVFGNAPTALFRLLEHNVTVSGVVGVPVGFVGAAESKEALTHSHFPAVAALGRKGGSNVAAAIVNALLYHLREA